MKRTIRTEHFDYSVGTRRKAVTVNVVRYSFRPANARFWAFQNLGWVKITLRPGQSLQWGKSYDNGEGWSWESCRWTHSGSFVLREYGSGGTDCDGRSSSSGEDCCDFDRLQSVPSFVEFGRPAVLRPDWQESAPVRCYDQFAQMAGY